MIIPESKPKIIERGIHLPLAKDIAARKLLAAMPKPPLSRVLIQATASRAWSDQPTNNMNTELKQILDRKNYTYTEADGKINVTHQGHVYLDSLTTLPEGTNFNSNGGVYLDSLTTLPEGTSFNNKGSVYLDSLTTLPEGTSFNNKGSVYLSSLKTLPEGTSFNNNGDVYLDSLTDEVQTYRGNQITLQNIDGYTMLIESEKNSKGIKLCEARYFGGGEIKELPKCYVAKVGNHWAHGKAAKEAIQDAVDKATLNADVADVVAEIKRTGFVTVTQYRAITGACREGCRQFLTSIGKPDATELPLADVMQKVKGHYGFDRFQKALNQ